MSPEEAFMIGALMGVALGIFIGVLLSMWALHWAFFGSEHDRSNQTLLR